MVPACIKVCPTGTLSFGPRDKILQEANKRLKSVKKRFPLARLIDVGEVSWIYILNRPEAEFQMTVAARRKRPVAMARRAFLTPFGAWLQG